MQHHTVEIDGVVFTTHQTPPYVRPRTRQYTRRAKMVYPPATSLSDDELSPSRSGPVESGGA